VQWIVYANYLTVSQNDPKNMEKICCHNDTEGWESPHNSLIVRSNKFIIAPVQIIRKMLSYARHTKSKSSQRSPGT